VPAGKTWAPGISTGWLNITIVFLSDASALTGLGSANATKVKQMIVATTLNRFTFSPLENR